MTLGKLQKPHGAHRERLVEIREIAKSSVLDYDLHDAARAQQEIAHTLARIIEDAAAARKAILDRPFSG